MKKQELLNKANYSELKNYSNRQIYENFIGCGGLYLATKMIRLMSLKKDAIVLDLGCGMGASSIYLAKNFNIKVISVDLWNSPNFLLEKSYKLGYSQKIFPLQFDITKNIPFASNYFDAIFCMNSLFMFGEEKDFLKRLFRTLKANGIIYIGSEGFNKHPDYDNIPDVYNFEWSWDVWNMCYSKYRSVDWWRSRILSTGVLDISYCEELSDGRNLFEDFALNYYEYIDKSIIDNCSVIPQEKIIEQIKYGKETGLYPTLYLLLATKK
jgi:SAM-dependent methyltransferase